MSIENITDVWRTIYDELGIHMDNFEAIPAASGVYAWFYPLYVKPDFDDFIEDIRKVHLYNAWTKGPLHLEDKDPLPRIGWFSVKRTIQLENPPVDVRELREAWETLKGNDDDFFKLRQVFMRASLLMPPLYVGKAGKLNERCNAHIRGASQFAKRYQARAQELKLRCRKVKDLILLTLKTPPIEEEGGAAAEDLVERILNLVARPPYGMK